MRTYSVLVVDDSALMRQVLRDLINKNPRFRVVDTARNGRDAISKTAALRPDVVTMDVTMPDMDGLAALREIMSIQPVPVVMLSALTEMGAQATVEALALGAVDFIAKHHLFSRLSDQQVVEEFFHKLVTAASANIHHSARAVPVSRQTPAAGVSPSGAKFAVVLFGTSTGGPAALRAILPSLPGDFPLPVVVCQHMPTGFTRALARSLDSVCKLRVKEVEDGEPLNAGTVYLAPSGFQTVVQSGMDGRVVFRVQPSPPDCLYRPSLDITLRSLADVYKERVLSVILTGMGKDGTDGCRLIKAGGGYVITEAEQTCVVYGMPKSVVEAGCSDRQVPLYEIATNVVSLVR